MLDPELPDERRDAIASEARSRIDGAGSLKADNVWGVRKLAYEIRQRNEADYRFYRFEAESPLLDDLNHNLRITDGVLRFRIFKVDPDSPVIEPPPPVSLAASAPSRGPGGRRGRRDEGDDRGAPPPAAAAPEAAPSAPAEEAPAAPEPAAPAEPAEAPEPAAAAEPAADGEQPAS